MIAKTEGDPSVALCVLMICIIRYNFSLSIRYLHYLFYAEAPFPINALLSLIYIVCYKGGTTNFKIDDSGLEGCTLYPEVNYVRANTYLDKFL